jgi:hypothetical protein
VKSLRESSWNSASMLVFRNEVRTNIYNYFVYNKSIKHQHVEMVVVADDKMWNHETDNIGLRRFLLSITDNKTEALPGYRPVLITHNNANELHISNGTGGRLVRILFNEEENSYEINSMSDPEFLTSTIWLFSLHTVFHSLFFPPFLPVWTHIHVCHMFLHRFDYSCLVFG